MVGIIQMTDYRLKTMHLNEQLYIYIDHREDSMATIFML